MYYYQYPKYGTQHYNTSQNTENLRMRLEGIGIVTVEADIAIVRLGVVTENKELRVAQQENAQRIQSVIDALLAIGVDREDIETESYSIMPMYDYVEGQQIFRGYRVTNSLRVTVENIQEVGRVIDTASESGANVVYSVNFTLSDPSEAYKAALSQAIMNAVSKAASIEGTLNITVDKTPIDIVEESFERPITRERDELRAPAAGTPILGGQIEVVSRVRAIFSYRRN